MVQVCTANNDIGVDVFAVDYYTSGLTVFDRNICNLGGKAELNSFLDC